MSAFLKARLPVTVRPQTAQIVAPASRPEVWVRQTGLRFPAALALGAVLGIGGIPGVRAKEPQAEQTLREVVVTTTRVPQGVADEPTHIEVVGPEEISEQIAMSPGDVTMLLNETLGLRVQTVSPAVGAANVRIVGLPGRYTQVLLDGLPIYGSQMGSLSLLQIPPLDLGRVEVLKGVASALYGASALSGIVNFISRPPDGEHELLLNETSRQQTDASLWWAGAPNPRGWSYSLLASASRQVMQDVNGDGWADIPGFRRVVIRPRLYWRDKAGRELYLTAGATLEDRIGGTVAGGYVPSRHTGGTPFRMASKTHDYDLGLIGRWPLARGRLLTVRASFTDLSLQQTFGEVIEPTHSHTGFAEMTLNGVSGPNSWVVGAAFEQYAFRDDAFPTFDYTYNVPGLFAQDDYKLSDAWILEAGGRIDHHSRYGTFVSPRLALLWRPGGKASPWQVRLAFGTGFYAPTPMIGDTAATGLARVEPLMGNLRAERARSISADLERAWTLSDGSLKTDLTVFGSSVSHAVDLAQVSATPPRFALENSPRPLRTLGTQFLVRWRTGPFTFSGRDEYVNATRVEPGATARTTVPLNPRNTAILTAEWEKEGVGAVDLEALYTGRQSLKGTQTPNPYRVMSPSFVMFGILLERHFGPVTVFLNGENLTDRRVTRFQPLVLPARAPDGRWTTDAWGPLDGRVINLELRWRFGSSAIERDTD